MFKHFWVWSQKIIYQMNECSIALIKFILKIKKYKNNIRSLNDT